MSAEALVPHSSNGTSIAATDWRSLSTLAEQLSRSGIIPVPLRNKPQDVLVVLLTGHELGLAPMQALRGIYVVDGKPVMAADMAAALVLARRDVCRVFQCKESTEKRCVYIAQRADDAQPTETVFTIEDAARAKLTGKQNWTNYPKAMLRARCCMAAARERFPDLLAGVYEPDEAEAFSAPVKGRVVEEQPKTLDEVVAKSQQPAPEPPAETLRNDTIFSALSISIAAIENIHHWANWKKAHREEVNALAKDQKKRIVELYEAKKSELESAQDGPEPPADMDLPNGPEGE